jgi:hypothetical protein
VVVADALAELAQGGLEMAHELMLRILAERGGDLVAPDRGEPVRGPGPVRAHTGLDRAKAGEARGLAQRRKPSEPKLMALSVSRNAARVSSGVPGARSGAGGDSAGSVAA